MKTTQEMIEVMQHFADGGEVQFKHLAEENWMDTKPLWDWVRFDYRIKPRRARAVEIKELRPGYPDPWGAAWVLGKCPRSGCVFVPFVELTPEVKQALDAVGVDYEKECE